MWLPMDEADWVHEGAQAPSWKLLITAALTLAAAVAAYRRTRSPIFLGFLFCMGSLAPLAADQGGLHEVSLVLVCVAFLLLGLALHSNSLVLPAAIALPLSVGGVSQRHLDSLCAWAGAVVIGGALLVALSFRMGSQGQTARAR